MQQSKHLSATIIEELIDEHINIKNKTTHLKRN
ncbi:MAG: hypothetical protein ACJA1P_001881, partial [Maribacter sp.]